MTGSDLGNAGGQFSKDGFGRNTCATACALLNLGAEGFRFHGAKVLAVFQGAQSIADDFAGTGVATLLNLVFDEDLEMFTDDIA